MFVLYLNFKFKCLQDDYDELKLLLLRILKNMINLIIIDLPKITNIYSKPLGYFYLKIK